MSTEIEVKMKIDSFADTEYLLYCKHAEFVGEYLITDYLFDNKDESLIKSDKCLRLRHKKIDMIEYLILTYKGVREKSEFKKRQEINLAIKSTQKELILTLLSAIGYEIILTIEKIRSIWKYNECEIMLDNFGAYGNFIEIEGPNEKQIANVRNVLGLANSPSISKSYAEWYKILRD